MGKGQNFLQAKGVGKTIQKLVDGGGDEIIPIQNLGRKQFKMHGELGGGGGGGAVLGFLNSEEWLSLKKKIQF